MDKGSGKSRKLIPLILVFVCVYALLALLNIADPFSYWIRPFILWLVRLTGAEAVNLPDALVIGNAVIPWTRDCAGSNFLFLLWALLAWINRDQLKTPQFWIKMIMVIPASMVVNTLRVLTIVAYRLAFYPSAESVELHYLIGFLWLLPILYLLVGRRTRNGLSIGFTECTFLMTVLALGSANIGAPGGYLILLATLVLLLEMESFHGTGKGTILAGAAWLFCGLVIGISSMESLWIGYLVTCPFFFNPRRWRDPATYGVIASTVSLLAMHDYLQLPLFGFAGWKVWNWVRMKSPQSAESTQQGWKLPAPAILIPGLALPFLMPLISWNRPTDWIPANSQVIQVSDPCSYKLRVLAQPRDMELYCYLPNGEGRHHSLEVCMRYRGVYLTDTDGVVKSDGKFWMKQYFYQEGRLTSNYQTYLVRTFLPFSEAGVHFILTAPVDSIDKAGFELSADSTIKRLLQL